MWPNIQSDLHASASVQIWPVLARLFCTELANKVQEEQEEVESSANLNIQSQVPSIHCVHEEHNSDLSLSDDPPADETSAKKSSEYTPDDYLTWNGKKYGCM